MLLGVISCLSSAYFVEHTIPIITCSLLFYSDGCQLQKCLCLIYLDTIWRYTSNVHNMEWIYNRKKKWHLKESKTDTVVLTIALYAMCRLKTVESVSGKENVM